MEAEYQAAYLGFDDLLERVDYLVLVLPHTEESEGMIGAEQLARMKNTATLINVGRGALVDEEALAQALKAGEIAMAGLDVYRYEPLPADSPLIGMPNAVLLPHTGGGSNRQWGRGYSRVAGQNRRVFRCGRRRGVIKRVSGSSRGMEASRCMKSGRRSTLSPAIQSIFPA